MILLLALLIILIVAWRGIRPAPAVVGDYRGADRIGAEFPAPPVTRARHGRSAMSTARAVADTVTALERTMDRRMSPGSGLRPSPSSGRVSATPP